MGDPKPEGGEDEICATRLRRVARMPSCLREGTHAHVFEK